jgi:hypothetical protein
VSVEPRCATCLRASLVTESPKNIIDLRAIIALAPPVRLEMPAHYRDNDESACSR